MTITLHDAEQRYDLTHLDHLDRDAALPVVDRLGFQGDVAIVATTTAPRDAKPVPANGLPVVRGENGANTHLLVGDATVQWVGADLVLCLVNVPESATALLSHPEHGGLLLAPGSYQLRRQREQADVIRVVAD